MSEALPPTQPKRRKMDALNWVLLSIAITSGTCGLVLLAAALNPSFANTVNSTMHSVLDRSPEFTNAYPGSQPHARSPISRQSVEIRDQALVPSAVAHIQVDDIDDDSDQPVGNCSGVLIGPTTVATAGHCTTLANGHHLSFTISPQMHRNLDGVVERPYGTCRATSWTYPYGYNTSKAVGDDLALLIVDSCSDEQGTQQTSLRTIGDRTGTIPTVSVTRKEWQTSGRHLTSYGYPVSDPDGNLVNGERLYRLPVKPCGDRAVIARKIGANVRVWCNSLAEGASGGPVILDTQTGPELVTTITRKEVPETAGAADASSGPILRSNH